MVDPHEDPIELEPSRDDDWRAAYERERDRIRESLAARDLAGEVERVEHIGSTSVPGLAAKDIVDLDVVVADGAVEAVASALVEVLGGTHIENSAAWHPVAREHDGQRFNDHVFAASSEGWRTSVATRDVLRARPALREAYEDLKRGLVADDPDLESYSRGKSEFIDRLLEVAREDDDVDVTVEVPGGGWAEQSR